MWDLIKVNHRQNKLHTEFQKPFLSFFKKPKHFCLINQTKGPWFEYVMRPFFLIFFFFKNQISFCVGSGFFFLLLVQPVGFSRGSAATKWIAANVLGHCGRSNKQIPVAEHKILYIIFPSSPLGNECHSFTFCDCLL